jgi:hypothetical protein
VGKKVDENRASVLVDWVMRENGCGMRVVMRIDFGWICMQEKRAGVWASKEEGRGGGRLQESRRERRKYHQKVNEAGWRGEEEDEEKPIDGGRCRRAIDGFRSVASC